MGPDNPVNPLYFNNTEQIHAVVGSQKAIPTKPGLLWGCGHVCQEGVRHMNVFGRGLALLIRWAYFTGRSAALAQLVEHSIRKKRVKR